MQVNWMSRSMVVLVSMETRADSVRSAGQPGEGEMLQQHYQGDFFARPSSCSEPNSGLTGYLLAKMTHLGIHVLLAHHKAHVPRVGARPVLAAAPAAAAAAATAAAALALGRRRDLNHALAGGLHVNAHPA